MNNNHQFIKFTVFLALIIITFSGCASILYSVNIRTDGNVSSVLAGGTLNLRSSGRNIVWHVSSTIDGTGSVSNGTFISPNGFLTVAENEIVSILYVIASSLTDDKSDIRQIRIVTVTGVSITPQNEPAAAGRTLQFRAQVTGTNNPDNAVTWKVNSNPSGTGSPTHGTSINSSGNLTVSSAESLTTLYITATSMIDTTKSAVIPVNIVIPTVTQVTVNPSGQSIQAGRTMRFNASVTGTYEPENTVTWSVSSNASGTGAVTPGTRINSIGLLTVSHNESLSVLYITAVSAVDPTKSGIAFVNVLIPTVTHVSVSPSRQSVAAGSSYQFAASVAGTNNPSTAVTWNVSSNAAGTGAVTAGTSISRSGLLTVSASETVRTLFVFATSVFDPSKSGSVAINVTPVVTPPGVTPNPPAPTPSPPSVTPAPPTPTPPIVTPPPAASTPPAPDPAPSVPAVPSVTSVTINPSSFATRTNTNVQFSATVLGINNPNTAVTWTVTGGGAPRTTINANGRLTVAPNEWATTLTVTATSAADPTKSASAVVTITNNNANQGPNQGQ